MVTATRTMHVRLTPRRVGVVMAGVGSVGQAVIRVLEQRFSSPQLQVRIVAIGDSSGFLRPRSSTGQFEWADIGGIVTHKRRGTRIRDCFHGEHPVIVLDGFLSALHHVSEHRHLDDYVVVDCTSSTEIGTALIEARKLGFAVVMANKHPVGGPIEQYRRLTDNGRVGRSTRVRYEATVGAGIPVVNVLQRVLASKDTVKMIQCGLSGTMTYILSAMNRGATFSSGFDEARQLGITENDPREDLLGADLARKLTILAREMGMKVETSGVEIAPLLPQEAFKLPVSEFIQSLHEHDEGFAKRVQAAKEGGLVLAYIGTIHGDGRMSIGLEQVPPTSPFAAVSSSEGVVLIASEWFPEPLILRGTGAGAASTAAAVVGDLSAIIHEVAVHRT